MLSASKSTGPVLQACFLFAFLSSHQVIITSGPVVRLSCLHMRVSRQESWIRRAGMTETIGLTLLLLQPINKHRPEGMWPAACRLLTWTLVLGKLCQSFHFKVAILLC